MHGICFPWGIDRLSLFFRIHVCSMHIGRFSFSGFWRVANKRCWAALQTGHFISLGPEPHSVSDPEEGSLGVYRAIVNHQAMRGRGNLRIISPAIILFSLQFNLLCVLVYRSAHVAVGGQLVGISIFPSTGVLSIKLRLSSLVIRAFTQWANSLDPRSLYLSCAYIWILVCVFGDGGSEDSLC